MQDEPVPDPDPEATEDEDMPEGVVLTPMQKHYWLANTKLVQRDTKDIPQSVVGVKPDHIPDVSSPHWKQDLVSITGISH